MKREVWYLNPLLSAPNLPAFDIARRDAHLIKTGCQRHSIVIDGRRTVLRRAGQAAGVDFQARLKSSRWLTPVIYGHADYVDSRDLFAVYRVE